MDEQFLKEQIARCRSLAEKADEFTKQRLLDLAERYEDWLRDLRLREKLREDDPSRRGSAAEMA